MYKFPRGWRWLLSGRLPRVDFLVTVATVTSDDLAEVPPSEFAPSVLLTQVPLHTHTHTQPHKGVYSKQWTSYEADEADTAQDIYFLLLEFYFLVTGTYFTHSPLNT